MSASTASVDVEPIGATRIVQAPAGEASAAKGRGGMVLARAHAYFASDHRRAIQTALGLVWLLDGGLQLQSFMYSQGFVQFLRANAAGQPGWLASSIEWARTSHPAQPDRMEHAVRADPARDRVRAAVPTHRQPRARRVLCVGARGVVVWRGLRDAVHEHGQPAHGCARGGTVVRDRRPAGVAERAARRAARGAGRQADVGCAVAGDGVAVAAGPRTAAPTPPTMRSTRLRRA